MYAETIASTTALAGADPDFEVLRLALNDARMLELSLDDGNEKANLPIDGSARAMAALRDCLAFHRGARRR